MSPPGDSPRMTEFREYDVVRVVSVPITASHPDDGFRVPRVGDTGAVVMVYNAPIEGYTVECVSPDGRTEWLLEFVPDDLEPA